jgi:hypothetical protein
MVYELYCNNCVIKIFYEKRRVDLKLIGNKLISSTNLKIDNNVTILLC